MKLTIVLTIFVWTSLKAAVLMPIPLKSQLKDASGVIHGVYLGSSYKRLPSGDVVTENSFKVLRSSGLKQNELVNKNSFKVLSPGGEYQGLYHNVPDSPRFEPNEEVVVIVKKTNYGFSVHNLSLGVYYFKDLEGELFFENDAFPSHSKLGQIPLDQFNQAVLSKFGFGLEISDDNKLGKSSVVAKRNRLPASISEENESKESRLSMFWLMVIFSCLGSFSIFSVRSKQ